ncbi:MAG TPA: tripartite tricarboxylate transporter substrate binding protein [Xanthobacteraceae bacterium]
MIAARWTLRILALLAAVVLVIGPASAQPYPSRVIKLIVPFSPGGQPDTIARIIAQHLSASVGTTIIDNRPGANTAIGTKAAAAAEPDGHTLLFGSSTSLAIAPALKGGDYDPVTGFAPVAMVSSAPFIMVVGPSVPAATVADFVAYAKAHPGKLNFAAPTGGPPHLAGEMFKSATGIDIVPVSYRAMNQAFTDLLAGQMDIIFDAPALLLPFIRDGKARALVVMDARRAADLPGVPTMAESGLPDLSLTVWNGIVAPAGTPERIVARLNGAINDGLRSPEVKAALGSLGSQPLTGSPQAFAAFIASEATKWADSVRAAGLRME